MKRADERLEAWAKAGGSSQVRRAATVVPLRDGPNGVEVLMLERSSKVVFGGMWVFPGGRVEADDERLAERAPDVLDGGGSAASDPLLDDLPAARRAAVREAAEETGLTLDTGALIAHSHWTPPAVAPKRYLTWFFLTAAPGGAIAVDGGEIREHAWWTPADALRRRDAGEIELAPPTYVTLIGLSEFRRVTDALEQARRRPPERFATRLILEDDGPATLWHGDVAWPEGDPHAPGPRHRLTMRGPHWTYERSPGFDPDAQTG